MVAGLYFAGCHALSDFPPLDGNEPLVDMEPADASSDFDATVDLGAFDVGLDISPDLDVGETCGEFKPPRSGLVSGLSPLNLNGSAVESLAFVAAVAEPRQKLTWAISANGQLEARQLDEIDSMISPSSFDLSLQQAGPISLTRGLAETFFIAVGLSEADCWQAYTGSIEFNQWQNINLGFPSRCSQEPLSFVAIAGGYNPLESEERAALWVRASDVEDLVISSGVTLGDLESPLAVEIANSVEVYSTTGDLIFFRGEEQKFYAWDAHQPEISRIFEDTGAAPFELPLGAQPSPHVFDVVHLEGNRYLFAIIQSGDLKIVEVVYESGALNTLNTTTIGANEPRWPTLALARDYIALTYFDTYRANESGRVYQLATWSEGDGFETMGEAYETFRDPASVKAIDSVAMRNGCDLVVSVVEVSGAGSLIYQVDFPVWENLYETP